MFILLHNFCERMKKKNMKNCVERVHEFVSYLREKKENRIKKRSSEFAKLFLVHV